LANDKVTIGRTDKVDLPDLSLFNVRAKIDTGAYTSSIHCSKLKVQEKEGKKYLYYTIAGARLGKGESAKKFQTDKFKLKRIRSSNGQLQQRYVIKTVIMLFGKKIKAEFSLADRSRMKNPILLGRKLLNGRFVVDVSKEHLSFLSKTSSE